MTPKLIWKKLAEKGCSEGKLTAVDPRKKNTCKSGYVAASQLPGGGPQMWMMLLHLHVNQNVYDDEYSKLIHYGLNVLQIKGSQIENFKIILSGSFLPSGAC